MIFLSLFLVLGLYSFVSVGSLLGMLVNITRYDELQKRTVFNSLAFSMFFLLVIYLAQLILSFFGTAYQKAALIISAGGFQQGGLISFSPLHIDSFFFACLVISIVYTINRYRYGLIDGQYLIKRIIFPFVVILAIVVFPGLIFWLLKVIVPTILFWLVK